MIKFFPMQYAELSITEKCNLNCDYCSETNKRAINMSLLPFQEIDFKRNRFTKRMTPFGGEPLLNIEVITGILDKILESNIDDWHKQQQLESMAYIVTNGTLVKKYLPIIKKYNMFLQISLDGPKDIHDEKRLYYDKRGSFDDVMEAVQLCVNNKIKFYFHGTIPHDRVNRLFDIFNFYMHMMTDTQKYTLDEAIEHFKNNNFQFLFEGDYEDKDIDDFLLQIKRITDWIFTTEEYPFTREQRKTLFANFMLRRGSTCAAGGDMLTIDPVLDIYPCHRLATIDNREDYSLGSLQLDSEGKRQFKGFKIFNLFARMKFDKYIYSAHVPYLFFGTKTVSESNLLRSNLPFSNWCPSANIQSTGSAFYLNAKHSTFLAEFTNYINYLGSVYKEEIQ